MKFTTLIAVLAATAVAVVSGQVSTTCVPCNNFVGKCLAACAAPQVCATLPASCSQCAEFACKDPTQLPAGWVVKDGSSGQVTILPVSTTTSSQSTTPSSATTSDTTTTGSNVSTTTTGLAASPTKAPSAAADLPAAKAMHGAAAVAVAALALIL